MIDLHVQHNHATQTLKLSLEGKWEQSAAPQIHHLLEQLPTSDIHTIECDTGTATRLDISAAWLVYKQMQQWQQAGIDIHFKHFPEEYLAYFELPADSETVPQNTLRNWVREKITYIGCLLTDVFAQLHSAISFFGYTFSVIGHGLFSPRRLRMPSIFYHVFVTGIQAIPIIALLACLISIVITYQGGSELKDLGASIYTVDLVAVSILRELGVLLTAIMVAGRSSSAFAAEIGIMKTNQEIDALQVAGLNPYEILVVPRILALLIALPLLTLLADILALAIAAVISFWSLDISIDQFATRLQQQIELRTFFAGIIKAPFFAAIIAITGTWNGMQVDGSAESLGKHTTAAVVQAIFIVLFLDAVFSMFYYYIGF